MMSTALLGIGALLCLAMIALMCAPMAVGMLRRRLHHDNPPAAPTSPAPDRQPAPGRS
jgi:hypothetical protein